MTHQSLTGRRWILPQEGEILSPPQTLASLMRERGVGAEFLSEATIAFVAFTKAPAMQKAVARIRSALETKETVGIVGDYDCDGVTSTAQLTRYFRRHGTHPVVRLPHRIKDGYGVKKYMVDELCAQNVTLMITVDTGIGAAEEIAYANTKGIDVIVTDHHHVPERIPEAYAVVHPQICQVPLPHPSGAGVVFCLVHALEEGVWDERNIDVSLAMMGTIADVVPLHGINRLLTMRGLRELHALTSGPLAELRTQVGRGDAPLSSTDIAFRLAPRINAAGRLADPAIALQALLEGGDALAQLEHLNTTRQAETERFLGQASADIGIDMQDCLPVPPTLDAFLMLLNAEFAPGIIGLIAGKLTERTGRPSLVGSITGETVTASLRSPPSYHVTEALTRASHLLTTFGGHAAAAGCTFPLEHAAALQEFLRADAKAHTNAEDLLPSLNIDAIIEQKHLSLAFAEQLSLLEPFGQGNAEPRFLLLGTQLENVRCVGQEGAHLQAKAGDAKCIGFRLGKLSPHALEEPVDIVCKMDIDTWGKKPQVQLVIEDMRISTAHKKAVSLEK